MGGLRLLAVLAGFDIGSLDLPGFIIKDLHYIHIYCSFCQMQHNFHKHCIFIPYKLKFIIGSIFFLSAWVSSLPFWVLP